MKQFIVLAFLMLFAAGSMSAKDRVSPHTTVKGNLISVTYGQPSKKGREIFGELVPYGKVWRTGADEATEVSFNKDCVFGGKRVSKGTYTLFTIPEKGTWTVILNSKLGQWGAFDYDNVKDKDVLSVKITPKTTDKVTERFTIEVKKEGLTLAWDKTSLFIPAQ